MRNIVVENEKIIKENEKRKKVILALLNNVKNGRPYYDNERALNLLKYNYNTNNNENYKQLLEEVELKEPFKNGEEKKCITIIVVVESLSKYLFLKKVGLKLPPYF